MDDTEILHRIHDLVAREKELRQQVLTHEVDPAAEHAEVARLEQTLDQCWDLLRQRRAHREFGQDVEDSKVRDASTVENYRQ